MGPTLLVALCLVLRLLLLLDLRIYPVTDQGSYLAAAGVILAGGGEGSEIFHDRLPGYPSFLAVGLALFGRTAWMVLVAQALLGTASAWLAWQMARQMRAPPWGALLFGAFVGAHPLYLFSEHQVMAETLALFLALAGSVLLLEARRRGRLTWFFLAGLVFSALLVTRSNGVLFVLLWAGGVSLLPGHPRPWYRLLAVGLGVSSLVVPWIVRNRIVEGRWVLAANVPSARLVSLVAQGLLDPLRPSGQALSEHGFQADVPVTIHQAVKDLEPHRIGREELVAPLFADQVAGRRCFVALAAARSTLAAMGWRQGLTPTRGWLERNLVSQEALSRLEKRAGLAAEKLAGASGGRWTWRIGFWRRAALRYVDYGRLSLAVIFLAALAVALRRRAAIPLLLAVSYLATAVLHGVMLADHDRYTMAWDWVAVALAVSVFGLSRVPAEPPGSISGCGDQAVRVRRGFG